MNIDEYLDSADEAPKVNVTPVEVESTPRKAPGSSWSEQVDDLVTQINESIADDDYSTALDKYMQLKELPTQIVETDLKIQENLQNELNAAHTKLTQHMEMQQKKHEESSLQIKQLVALAYEELQHNNEVTASNLYGKACSLFNNLPKEFRERNSRAHYDILKVYFKIKEFHDKHMFEEQRLFVDSFNSAFKNVLDLLQKKNYAAAMEIHDELHKRVADLPNEDVKLKAEFLDRLVGIKNRVAYETHHTGELPKSHKEHDFAQILQHESILPQPKPKSVVVPATPNLEATSASEKPLPIIADELVPELKQETTPTQKSQAELDRPLVISMPHGNNKPDIIPPKTDGTGKTNEQLEKRIAQLEQQALDAIKVPELDTFTANLQTISSAKRISDAFDEKPSFQRPDSPLPSHTKRQSISNPHAHKKSHKKPVRRAEDDDENYRDVDTESMSSQKYSPSQSMLAKLKARAESQDLSEELANLDEESESITAGNQKQDVQLDEMEERATQIRQKLRSLHKTL